MSDFTRIESNQIAITTINEGLQRWGKGIWEVIGLPSPLVLTLPISLGTSVRAIARIADTSVT